MQYVAFCVWLLSLSIILFRLTHVVTCTSFFLWLNTIPLYRYDTIKNSLSSRWTFVWFSTFWKINAWVYFWTLNSVSLIYISVYKPLPHSSLFFLKTVIYPRYLILAGTFRVTNCCLSGFVRVCQGYKLCCLLFTDLTWDSIIMLMIW